MRTHTTNSRQAGFALESTLRVVLVIVVLGEILFLASRYRTRIDLTSDSSYTLTDSTRSVLANLDQRLVIEAYFSPAEKLGAALQDRRRMLTNFLDELVALSDERVRVEYIDPQSDAALRSQAERLGMQPQRVQDVGDASLSVNVVWQGMRLIYGGERQEVIPVVPLPDTPRMHEALLTPKIKALTVEDKPVIGVAGFPSEPVQGQPFAPRTGQVHGFDYLQNYVQGHYAVETVDLSNGQLVPSRISALMLLRPKGLTDRQKYVIDQFVMSGGALVVFADTAEVTVGNGRFRTFKARPVKYDRGGSSVAFLDQLQHYGAVVKDTVIADFAPEARDGQTEPFLTVQQTMLGQRLVPIDPYPYWIHADPTDYGEVYAERLAESAPGDNKAELEAQLRDLYQTGVATENVLFKSMKRGPAMFWPCPVELAPELPAGVTGEVLMRTSPVAFAEPPPPDFNPLGPPGGQQPAAAFNAFRSRLINKLNSEPKQQFGLMVHLEGEFTSYFDGREVPPLPGRGGGGGAGPGRGQGAPTPAIPNPLGDPLGGPPVKNGNGGGGGTGQDPEPTEGEQDPEGEQAPEGPSLETEEAAPATEASGFMRRAVPTASITVIGDATFMRDDTRAIQGQYGVQSAEYGPLGPTSLFAGLFFANLVDWLAEDQDLLALRAFEAADRVLKFAEDDPDVEREAYLAAIKSKQRTLTVLNIVGPFALIMLIWVVVALRRRARKQSFLSTVQ